MNNTRINNSIKNVVVATALHILSIIVSFVSRTILIKLLGEHYLGINGLYSNILQLLSLADLGITTAFVYSLYKPLAQKDYETLSSYLLFFKKIFYGIAVVILILGIFLVPVLPFIVNGSTIPMTELQTFFILSVLNISASYLGIYKSSLIKADQKEYVIKIVSTLTTILMHVMQIAVLFLTRNYYLYLVVAISTTLLNKFILTIIVNKYYNLKNIATPKLTKEQKKGCLKNVFSVTIYKLGTVIINSTDNILISILLGTIIVGYYSNYALIISIVTTFISILSSAILGSVGNLGTENNSKKTKTVFHASLLLYHAVAAFCSICLVCVLNDFILIWLNDSQYIFSQFHVFLFVFTFYVTTISNPLWIFRESLGLFSSVRYIMLISALINILLSILFSSFWGVGGIIFATGVSRLLTLFWYEPLFLYKKKFNSSCSEYWKHIFYYTIQTAIIIVVSYFFCSLITGTAFILIILKVIICFVITLLVSFLFNFKTIEGKYFINIIKKLVHKKRKA